MYKKVIIGIIVIFIMVLIVNFLNTKDLSTYRTYDIGNNSEEIVDCFDYNDTVYSNYLCVEDYINEQKVENPTDELVVLNIKIYENNNGRVELEFRTAYIDSKVDFIPDWLNEYSNPFYISRISCSYKSEDICEGSGDIRTMDEMSRDEAIELFNLEVENWEQEEIIYYAEREIVLFPEENVNNEKYMSLISINGENMDEFWNEVEKGIENGEIKVVE